MWQINNFVQFVTSLFYFVLCLENFDLFVRKWASIFLSLFLLVTLLGKALTLLKHWHIYLKYFVIYSEASPLLFLLGAL